MQMKGAVRHLPAAVAVLAALGLGGVAVRQGTWAVGGSDSACYGLMAKTLASENLQPASGLALRAPWPDGATTFAPAGFVRSPVREGAASPVCAPGFSLLLVPFVWLRGLDGIFWATPVASVLLVWLAFVLGRRLAGGVPGAAPATGPQCGCRIGGPALGGPGEWAGVLAAVLVATSPIVLYQAVQPMNDVTTAMLWLAVVVAASSRSSRRLLKSSVSTTEDTTDRLQATGSRRQAWLLGRGPKSDRLRSGYGDPPKLHAEAEARSLKPFAAGALTGLALLVRPNLLPAALVAGIAVPFLHIEQITNGFRTFNVRLKPDTTRGFETGFMMSVVSALAPRRGCRAGDPAFRRTQFRGWLIAAMKFAVGALPGLIVIAWLNATLYGSALHSGYGDLASLFALSFIPTRPGLCPGPRLGRSRGPRRPAPLPRRRAVRA